MASLWEQLSEILPDVLPKHPSEACNGTQLLYRVQPRLRGEFKPSSIRQHFSRMAADSMSPIAKVDSGHGYYLRDAPEANGVGATEEPQHGGASGLDAQAEEKFRAFFMRFAQLQNRFGMRVDHTRAERVEAGINKWKFPDVVLLDWEVGQLTEDGFYLDKNLLEVKRSLGEQPFRLTSVELKVSLTLRSFREAFFQCVSNSKWAHHALLVVAGAIEDTTLVEELQRLGASYDVSIVSYSMDLAALREMPPASRITDMSDEDFDALAAERMRIATIATGRRRPGLDWDHIEDMRSRTADFVVLFEWIAHCLKESRPFKFDDFRMIAEVQQRYS